MSTQLEITEKDLPDPSRSQTESTSLFVADELLALRQRCLDDPMFLGAYVLDLGEDNYFTTPADFHVEALNCVKNQENVLFLAPRNHAKTTLIDVVGTVWQLLKHPNDRILIASSTVDNAAAILRQVTHQFRACEKLAVLFPEYRPRSKDEEGSMTSYTVPCRTHHPKEASIEVCGENTKITGRHYDVIRCSDLVVRENVPPWSPEKTQMTQTTEWFRTTAALLDTSNPRAHRTIDGTRWHDGDLYGEIIRSPGYGHFKKIISRILNDEQGLPIPVWSRMPQKKLIELRGEAGDYLWAANYMNDPLPADDASSSRREWFKVYEDNPPVMDVAITVDLAISEKTEADRTAIVVSGVTPEGNLYVLQCTAGRWTPYVVVEKIFDLCAFWNPSYVGIESVAWQKAMLFILDQEMRRRGQFVPLRELIPDARKERRAAPLSQHAQRHGIYVRIEHSDLVDELCRFPAGRHDDYVDALAYRAQDLYKPVLRLQETPKVLTHAPSSRMVTGDELLELLLPTPAAWED